MQLRDRPDLRADRLEEKRKIGRIGGMVAADQFGAFKADVAGKQGQMISDPVVRLGYLTGVRLGITVDHVWSPVFRLIDQAGGARGAL